MLLYCTYSNTTKLLKSIFGIAASASPTLCCYLSLPPSPCQTVSLTRPLVRISQEKAKSAGRWKLDGRVKIGGARD